MKIMARTSRGASRMRRVDELFGVWAMEAGRTQRLIEFVRTVDIRAHLSAFDESGGYGGPQVPLAIDGNIGLIGLCGVMTKSGAGDSLTQTVSTAMVRQALRECAANAQISAIVLMIDSPGGAVSGTGDLGDDIARINAIKPVIAYAEDCCCSAAYWAASQCTAIVANRFAMVGSIGTYAVIDDVSKMYESKGIRTHVIRAGQFKGAGTTGSEITDEHLAEFQREVDACNATFLAAVASGRGMTAEQVSAVADGRSHMAQDALALGLIDKIATYDGMLAMARSMTTKGTRAVARPKAATVKGDNMPVGMCKLPDGSETEMDQKACEDAGGEWTAPADDGGSPGEGLPGTNDGLDIGSPDGPLGQSGKAATIAEAESAAPGAPAAKILEWVKAGKSANEIVCLDRDRLRDENATLRAQIDRNKGMVRGGPAVAAAVSSSHGGEIDAEAAIKAEWESDAGIRKDFRDNFRDFAAFAKNRARSQNR